MTTKLTVEVDEVVATRVAAAEAERGVAPETLAAEVLPALDAASEPLSLVTSLPLRWNST